MESNKKNKLSFLANLDVIIASVILALLIVLTFAGVIWRYIFHAPFTWLEEVQTSCMVWITFAAAGAAFRTGNHVAIEMIVDLMPKNYGKIDCDSCSCNFGISVYTDNSLFENLFRKWTFNKYVTYSVHCSIRYFDFFLYRYGNQFYL